MGMYDHLKIDRELPGPNGTKVDGGAYIFQTKSLDSTMSYYAVNPDGRLLMIDQYFKRDEDKDKPFVPVDQEHHGYLYFYAVINKALYDYKAKFTDGVLVDITFQHAHPLKQHPLKQYDK